MEGLELICFQIISNSGDAKSSLLEAIEFAKKGEFNESYKKIDNAKRSMLEAHKVHAELIRKDISGDINVKPSLLLIHAEDQFMQTELLNKLTEEFIEVYIKIYK